METVQKYLQELLPRLQKILEKRLIGLYQIGSSSLGDYKEGKSDIDIIGVLSGTLSDRQRNELSKTLDHRNFPCPAKGLDLALLTQDAVKNIVTEPEYEFWFSTGASWRYEKWEKGRSREMLIFIELCRRHGITLLGNQPDKVFAPVKKSLLIQAFLKMLQWHQNKILDVFHDPQGQYSVLNACRILAFVKEDRLLSKSDGGKWLLAKDPDNEIVKKALALRNGKHGVKISKTEIATLLERIISEIESTED